MALYLSIDGGGTKCIAVLFDESLRLLGTGLSGGVNTTQNSPETARQHIAECLEQVFAGRAPQPVERVYLNLLGDRAALEELLRQHAQAREIRPVSEPLAALLAGSLRTEGMVAHAGTGSDAFWVGGLRPRPGVPRLSVVGAWGPILGDQGSGAWIGQQALLHIVRAVDGWAPETAMTDMLMREWALSTPYDMVPKVYRSPAPFRLAASLTRLVGAAADAGDAVALGILTAAGEQMAEQIAALVRKLPELAAQAEVLCAGGAWKTHRAMLDGFRAHLARLGVAAQPVLPAFDPVAAGPVQVAFEQGMTAQAARALIADNFPRLVNRWQRRTGISHAKEDSWTQ